MDSMSLYLEFGIVSNQTKQLCLCPNLLNEEQGGEGDRLKLHSLKGWPVVFCQGCFGIRFGDISPLPNRDDAAHVTTTATEVISLNTTTFFILAMIPLGPRSRRRGLVAPEGTFADGHVHGAEVV
jgi:hypothetical protein